MTPTHPDPEARAREILQRDFKYEFPKPKHVRALAVALREEHEQGDREGYQRGIRDAAKVAESYRLSNEKEGKRLLTSPHFHSGDERYISEAEGAATCAADIAFDIRALAKQGGSGGQG